MSHAAVQVVAVRKPKTKPVLHARHQATYRERRKQGLQPVKKPWDWITVAQVQELAKEAYLMASHDLSDAQEWPSEPDAAFVQELASVFEILLSAMAQKRSIRCAPASAEHYAQMMRSALPATWRPQYPLYQKLTPASATNASGAVINADEGNVNGSNCSS